MTHRQYFKAVDPAVLCPIAGYVDKNNPVAFHDAAVENGYTPELMCPVNGYYDPNLPIPYVADPQLPVITPNSGEIVLLLSNLWDAAVNCTTTRTGVTGNIRYTVYGNNNTQLFTQDVASGTAFFYQFPTTGGILLSSGLYAFKVIIKVATVGTLNTFTMTTKGGYAPNGWPLIEAHFNAPTLTSLAGAFSAQKSLQFVKFHSDHNALTSLATFCYVAISLRSIDLGVKMNALTTMSQMCEGTTILENVIMQTSLSALTSLFSAFRTSGIKQAPTYPTLPEVTTIERLYSDCPKLAGTITMPYMPKCTMIQFSFLNLMFVKKIKFTGNCNFSTGAQSMRNCPMLEEVDMDSTSTWGTVGGTALSIGYLFYGLTNLKKITFPAAIVNLTTASANSIFYDNPWPVQEMSVCDWSQNAVACVITILCYPRIYNQPTLKISGTFSLQCTAARPGNVEYCQIDWINSTLSTIRLDYQKLGAAELNRIFTALPTVTPPKYIYITGNPGEATCTKSIATAKGWTVY